VPVVEQAITSAGIHASDIIAVAVTQGPGLVGALLVGFSFARAFAYMNKIPLCGVDHLEGHIHSLFLESGPPEFPFVVLLASGGHTGIYHVKGYTRYELLGQTLDDAAGEAFDKVAKMLGLGYPGGPFIGKIADSGDGRKIVFPRIWLDKSKFDFSFSGIKSAVNRYIQTHPEDFRQQIPDIAAGFQEAVTDVLCYKLIAAAQYCRCSRIALAGGVAANGRLQQKIQEEASRRGLSLQIPALRFCGDNGAMIAAAGYRYLEIGRTCGLTEDVYSRHRH
jgi:N6-L-threonylcarbamoyladenine synthase